MEAQRFMQPHPGVQLEIPLLEKFFAAGVARIQNGHVVSFGQTVDGTEQVEKIFLGVDVLLPMGREQDIAPFFKAQPLQHIAGFDLGKIGTQDLGHGAARHIGALFGRALGVQIAARMLGVAQVHVADVIHDAAVGLLGQALVKAAVAGLHVKDGDVQALGCDGGKTAVRVAQNQQRVGLLLRHQRIALGNDVADGLSQITAHGVQVKIRRAQFQILEENLVERIVVILARVDQKLIEIPVAFFDDGGKADDLRPCADDGHEFNLFHVHTSRK